MIIIVDSIVVKMMILPVTGRKAPRAMSRIKRRSDIKSKPSIAVLNTMELAAIGSVTVLLDRI